jgi:hypothetical protein
MLLSFLETEPAVRHMHPSPPFPPGRSVKLNTHLLVPRSRMSGVISQLPQYAFMAWCSVKAQGQLTVLRGPLAYPNGLLDLHIETFW